MRINRYIRQHAMRAKYSIGGEVAGCHEYVRRCRLCRLLRKHIGERTGTAVGGKPCVNEAEADTVIITTREAMVMPDTRRENERSGCYVDKSRRGQVVSGAQ